MYIQLLASLKFFILFLYNKKYTINYKMCVIYHVKGLSLKKLYIAVSQNKTILTSDCKINNSTILSILVINNII